MAFNADSAGRSVTLAAAAAGMLLAVSGCESLPKLKMPMIASPPPCADFTISIYFEPGSAIVTKEARALIHSAAARARRCHVIGVDVVGLASPVGDSARDLQVSKDRATAVTAALAASSFEHVDFSVTAVGVAGAQTRAGEVRPLRRRANVTFHLAARPYAFAPTGSPPASLEVAERVGFRRQAPADGLAPNGRSARKPAPHPRN